MKLKHLLLSVAFSSCVYAQDNVIPVRSLVISNLTMKGTAVVDKVMAMYSGYGNGALTFSRANPSVAGSLYLDGIAFLTASNYQEYISSLGDYATMDWVIENYWNKTELPFYYYTRDEAESQFLSINSASIQYATKGELLAVSDAMSSGMELRGQWSAASSNTPATASNGWYWIISAAGTITNTGTNMVCVVGDSLIYADSSWSVISRGGVISVGGKVGVVTELDASIIASGIFSSSRIDEDDPNFEYYRTLPVTNTSKILTRGEGDALYAGQMDLFVESDPIWIMQRTNYLNLSSALWDCRNSGLFNVAYLLFTNGGSLRASSPTGAYDIVLSATGCITAPGTVTTYSVVATGIVAGTVSANAIAGTTVTVGGTNISTLVVNTASNFVRSLPASATQLGGIIAGTNLTISTNGLVGVPTASTNTRGVVKIGANISLASDGTISVTSAPVSFISGTNATMSFNPAATTQEIGYIADSNLLSELSYVVCSIRAERTDTLGSSITPPPVLRLHCILRSASADVVVNSAEAVMLKDGNDSDNEYYLSTQAMVVAGQWASIRFVIVWDYNGLDSVTYTVDTMNAIAHGIGVRR